MNAESDRTIVGTNWRIIVAANGQLWLHLTRNVCGNPSTALVQLEAATGDNILRALGVK